MKEGLQGIKNFEDETEYYLFYLKECESANLKLIKENEQLKKENEILKLSSEYSNDGLELTKKDNKELISIALWAIRRLPTERYKKFALNDLKNVVGDQHEFSEFIDKYLDEITMN